MQFVEKPASTHQYWLHFLKMNPCETIANKRQGENLKRVQRQPCCTWNLTTLNKQNCYQKLVKNPSCSMIYRCTLKNFLSSHDHQHMLSQGWTTENHRNRVKVEPTRKTRLDRTSTIYSRGNYFLCKEKNDLMNYFVALKQTFSVEENSSHLKLLWVAKAGFDNLLIWWPIRPRPMSCSLTDTKWQMLSSVLLSSIIPELASPMKCGIENSVEPIPIITAPIKENGRFTA